jgi:hypothetical protein
MELSAPLLKNYPSEVDGVLANGEGCLRFQISKWGEHPMVSARFFGLFYRRMTICAGVII